MEKRRFYIALGIPKDADAAAIQPAYQEVVRRYRRALQQDFLDEPTEPPMTFRVMRTYSERRHAALCDRPEPLDTSGDTEVDRYYRGFVPEAISRPAARKNGKDLFVELRLDAQDAHRGGLFPVHIPVIRACPSCGDRRDEHLVCAQCNGTGQITVDRMVEVTTPPGVTHGQVARLAMEDVGLGKTDLVVMILISAS